MATAEPIDAARNLPPPDQIKNTALEVITRSEFDISRRDHEFNFAALEAIRNFIRRLFAPLNSAFEALREASPVAYWFLIVFLVLILIALVTHIIWSIHRALRGRKKTASLAEDDGPPADAGPDYWENRARQAVGARDYVTAVRCLLHSSLVYLENATNSKVRRGATNREYLRRYARTPVVHALQVQVEMVDQKWYGDQPCAPMDFDECAAAHESIRRFAREKSQHASSA